MEDAIDPVVLLFDQVVAGNVEDDESLKLFQVDHLFDLIDLVVAKVKLHEGLHVFEAVQSLDQVVFQAELGEAFE